MVGIASHYPPQSRFMPFVVGIPAVALCLLQLYLDFRDSRRRTEPATAGGTPASSGTIRRELIRD